MLICVCHQVLMCVVSVNISECACVGVSHVDMSVDINIHKCV